MKLRLMTYNVHRCVGTDRKLDVERVAEVIAAENADVVALQELDVRRARTKGVDQAHRLAELLKMRSHFHPAMARLPQRGLGLRLQARPGNRWLQGLCGI